MTVYDIYSNRGIPGAPVDYSAPIIAGLTSLAFTPWALSPNADYVFGVRARDSVSGLSEQNVDAIGAVNLDVNGRDITARPLPPVHLRVTPVAGGAFWLDWAWPYPNTVASFPQGFHVYAGQAPGPNYGQVLAAVAYRAGLRFFRTKLAGLAAGATYYLAVRAFNGAGEETNLVTVAATTMAAPPLSVINLSGGGTSVANKSRFTLRRPTKGGAG